MKFICDFSFISDYVENFFSNNDRKSANIVNSSITPYLQGKPLLVVSYVTIKELKEIFDERILVLDSLFSTCEKSDINRGNRIQDLIKMAAISEIEDKETYILVDDSYIKEIINKTTHKAVLISEATTLLRNKNILIERGIDSTENPQQSTTTDSNQS